MFFYSNPCAQFHRLPRPFLWWWKRVQKQQSNDKPQSKEQRQWNCCIYAHNLKRLLTILLQWEFERQQTETVEILKNWPNFNKANMDFPKGLIQVTCHRWSYQGLLWNMKWQRKLRRISGRWGKLLWSGLSIEQFLRRNCVFIWNSCFSKPVFLSKGLYRNAIASKLNQIRWKLCSACIIRKLPLKKLRRNRICLTFLWRNLRNRRRIFLSAFRNKKLLWKVCQLIRKFLFMSIKLKDNLLYLKLLKLLWK